MKIVKIFGQLQGHYPEKDIKNEFALSKLKTSPPIRDFRKMRDIKYNTVSDELLKVWREKLTSREKFYMWFKYFNSFEKVRLWNKLVFAREWFRSAVRYSKELEQRHQQDKKVSKSRNQDDD